MRLAIAAGELTPGAALPSVRALATQLAVNLSTVTRAYRELEKEGLVATRKGAGTFVEDVRGSRPPRDRAAEAKRLARELVAAASRRGISFAELRQAIEKEM